MTTRTDGTFILPFPFIIVFDILSRLPIKSILRFESVSKPLSALIKSPDFAAAHLRRHSSTASLLIRRQLNPTVHGFSFSLVDVQTAEIRNVAIPFLDHLSRLPKIVGSSCGLVCLDISLCYASAFVLWNLVTGKFRRVLSSRTLNSPDVWMVATGFGSDRHNSDIKIVRIVYLEREKDEFPPVRAEVYSWGLGIWRLIDPDLTKEALESCTITEGQRAVTVNGALHWVGLDISMPSTGKLIVSFDLNTEEFSRIPIPDHGSGCAMCVELMGLKGKLALAMYPTQSANPNPGIDFMELWSLDDIGGKCWTKMTTLKPGIFGIEIPLGIFNDSELITKMDDGNVVHISIVDADGRVKWKFPVAMAEFSCEVFSYVGSLFSVAPFEEVDVLQG
ncbi:F-box/kelch-repeat protein At3g06240 [Linum perenne]